MPVLDYGPLLSPEDLYRAQLAVRAVMAWPDPADDQFRRGYVATVFSIHLAEIKAELESLPDPIAAKGWPATIRAVHQHERVRAAYDEVHAQFEEAGGHAVASRAPGIGAFNLDFSRRVFDWFAAGLVLSLVQRMAAHHSDLPGGASVNKAIFILEKGIIPLIPRNSHDLRRAWSTYKPVAHFCAVLFDWFCIAMQGGGKPEKIASVLDEQLNENIIMFLCEAEAYLEFGLSYKPQRAKAQSLLNPDEIWNLPQDRPWPKSQTKPGPLVGPLLDAALEYRAPRTAG